MSPPKASQPLRERKKTNMSRLKSVWTNSRLSSSSCGTEAGHLRLGGLEDFPVLGKERLGDRLDIEGFRQGVADDPFGRNTPIDVGDLLDGGAARQVALDHHAPQRGLRVLEGWVDEVHLAARGVGEEQQQVFAKLVRDQLGCRGRLGPSHPVGAGYVKRDVTDVDAVQRRDALGCSRQRDAGGSRTKRHLPGRRVEVQGLDKQPPEFGDALVG